MSNLLVIFGVTGQQGGSLAHHVLSDPSLSAHYRVRGITRDRNQPAATELRAKGAEIVQADLDDPSSLKPALEGVHTVFITTVTIYDDQAKEREVRQGKAAADAAVAAGAMFIIYSTTVHCEVLSGGKHRATAYDARGEVEAYIRSLPVKSAFYAPGSFMQNLGTVMAPRLVEGEGWYAIRNIVRPERLMPWIEIVKDTGKVVGAMLAEPERFEGRRVYAAAEMYTYEEVAGILTRLTGKEVRYVRVSEEEFRGFLPPAAREPVVGMFKFIDEFGYYGPGGEERVRETKEMLGGEWTQLEEYIRQSIRLE